jgi:glycerol-3-phosphate cytidylyltransferase
MSVVKGFTCSAFDLLHAGHIEMLRECKEHCDWLIVGLHVNPRVDRPEKNKPVQSVYERMIQLRGCKYVDEIIPYDTEEDLINLLGIEPIDVRFVGIEYKDVFLTGQDICNKRGIQIIYNNRWHGYSSRELRSRLT